MNQHDLAMNEPIESIPSGNPEFWKRKLLAFLHDPPHKPFRIAGHEDARATALIACGLSVEEMKRWQAQPDWTAAAADRFTFPDPNKSRVKTDWRDERMIGRGKYGYLQSKD